MKITCLILIIAFCSINTLLSKTEVINLRCNYLKDPIGISTRTPRLSWKIISGDNSQNQTAYQILVASLPELLTASRADLWNSGKTTSSQSLHIEYGGKSSDSRQKSWWTVRVWDINGKVLPDNELIKDAGLDYHFLKTYIGSGKYFFETEYEL